MQDTASILVEVDTQLYETLAANLHAFETPADPAIAFPNGGLALPALDISEPTASTASIYRHMRTTPLSQQPLCAPTAHAIFVFRRRRLGLGQIRQ